MRALRGVLPPLSSPGTPAPNPKGCACRPGFLLNLNLNFSGEDAIDLKDAAAETRL